MGRRHFDEIDYSTLPDSWQMYIAGGSLPASGTQLTTGASPYETLFLLEGAPLEVVRVAYHALANLYHPDRGGDSARMVEITAAYDEIRAKNQTT